jgi:hypothetical protein
MDPATLASNSVLKNSFVEIIKFVGEPLTPHCHKTRQYYDLASKSILDVATGFGEVGLSSAMLFKLSTGTYRMVTSTVDTIRTTDNSDILLFFIVRRGTELFAVATTSNNLCIRNLTTPPASGPPYDCVDKNMLILLLEEAKVSQSDRRFLVLPTGEINWVFVVASGKYDALIKAAKKDQRPWYKRMFGSLFS